MSETLTYLPLVSPVATLVVVFVGILFSNRHVDTRISDLLRSLDERFKAADERFIVFQRAVDQRFTDTITRLEARIDLRASEVRLEIVELRQRVERLEEQRLVK